MARRNLEGISIAPLSEQRLSGDGLWSAPRLGGRRADGGGAPPGIHDLFNGDPPITGSANPDFILVLNGADSTVDAGDGGDIVVDSAGPIDNDPIGATGFATASDLDSNLGLWTTDENAMFADSGVPHRTVYEVAEAGAAHYYKIVMAVGQTITLDIDGADEALGGADDTDTILDLFHEGDLVNPVASNDDSAPTDGGYGSFGSFNGGAGTRDSYISFTATVAGTYYIAVAEFDSPFEGGEQFLLNVSLTGHAIDVPTAQGDLTVTGGAGDDLLLGAGGDDRLDGGLDNDTIDGGTGNDRLDGGVGNDSLVGGSTSIYDSEILFGRDDNDTLIGGMGLNNFDAGAGNDSIVGNGFLNGMSGGAGADTLVGGAGFDLAVHTGGVAASVDLAADSVAGGDADGDVLSDIDGYAGAAMNDTIAGSATANLLGGLGGDDLLTGLGGNDSLDGGTGQDTLDGGDDDDLVGGDAGLDSLAGGSGADNIFGGADNDTIAGGLGADVIFGDGPSFINAAPSFIRNDNFAGARFASIQGFSIGENPLLGDAALATYSTLVEATAGQEEFFAVFIEAGQTITIDVDFGNSTDTIVELIEVDSETLVASNDDSATNFGGLGSSTTLDSYLSFLVPTTGSYYIRVHEFDGGTFEGDESFLLNVSLTAEMGTTIAEGADSIASGGDDDQVFAGGGDDTVNGDAGFDLLMGGSGGDSLFGGADGDSLDGGGGADTLNGGQGADVLSGGGASDWADYSGSGLKVIADLLAPANNTNDAAGDSYISIENLRGGGRADQLNGNNGANILEGGAKSDFLGGGQGDDTLIGGVGKDTLRGAAGADEFHLTNLAVDGFDKIKDFIGGDDLIVLDGSVFGLAPGALAPGNFVVANGAQDADDFFYYKAGPGTLFFDADGNGAGAAIQIATLIGAPPLGASDFLVI